MTAPQKIPWGVLLSNLVWIFGSAIILATWSYQKGIARIRKTRARSILERENLSPVYGIGIILICIGIALSAQLKWITLVFILVALTFAMMLIENARQKRRLEKSIIKEVNTTPNVPISRI